MWAIFLDLVVLLMELALFYIIQLVYVYIFILIS